MRNKLRRIWVSEDFAKAIKKEACNRDKSIIQMSSDLANDMEAKKTEKILKRWGNLRL